MQNSENCGMVFDNKHRTGRSGVLKLTYRCQDHMRSMDIRCNDYMHI